MASDRPIRHCAVYTRKSSDEGLEQEFNSLDAQREAGEAYIKSQSHEGWRLVKTHYDDGGISGGTLDRPALQTLLADIRAGKVQIIVVYKVDRLTRSLSDFAKLIEVFETHGVSFVSVTQQFNTTTSMGRLMLNVLLSFAQFEREVTGERIRDKIAASRKKGIWMGGHPPIGYDCKDRKLLINEAEAKIVRHIFSRFATLQNIRALQAELDRNGYRTKDRVSTTGNRFGGIPFSRGHLYRILSNRVYLGEAVHKGTSYPGEHEAIIDAEVWARVQEILADNRHAHRTDANHEAPALLKGVLFDDAGNRMSPTHTGKGGRRYRYYVSQAILQHQERRAGSLSRMPAHDLERLVTDAVLRALSEKPKTRRAVADYASFEPAKQREFLRSVIQKVEISQGEIRITISDLLQRAEADGPDHEHGDAKPIQIAIAFQVIERRGSVRVVPSGSSEAVEDGAPSSLIKSIARGFYWREKLLNGEVSSVRELAQQLCVTDSYVSRMLKFGFKAPAEINRVFLRN